VEGEEDLSVPPELNPTRRRLIPTAIKLEVSTRDAGKCVLCGATDELHFDHDLPWAKGGTSLVASNVQLLCARHNLAKHDHIE
jgi:5-methylcytosine-specific restriction endonuclease McrA